MAKEKLTEESENVPIKDAFKKAEAKTEREAKQFSPADLARGISRKLSPTAKAIGKELKETGSLAKKEVGSTLSQYKPSEALKRKIAEREYERSLRREYAQVNYPTRRQEIRRRVRQERQRQTQNYPSLFGQSPIQWTGFRTTNKKASKQNTNLLSLGGNKTNLITFGSNAKPSKRNTNNNLLSLGKANNNLLSMGNSNYNLLAGKKKKEVRFI